MFNPKNLKIVKTITKLKRPHLNWIMFSKIRDYKIKSSYVDLICNNADNEDFITSEIALRNMVEETLMREFSADVKNLKSYDLLVNAVIENIKNKHEWLDFNAFVEWVYKKKQTWMIGLEFYLLISHFG